MTWVRYIVDTNSGSLERIVERVISNAQEHKVRHFVSREILRGGRLKYVIDFDDTENVFQQLVTHESSEIRRESIVINEPKIRNNTQQSHKNNIIDTVHRVSSHVYYNNEPVVGKSINELEHLLAGFEADRERVTSYLLANDIEVNEANLKLHKDKSAGDIRQEGNVNNYRRL